MTSRPLWFDDLQALMPTAVVTQEAVIAPHLEESRGRFQGACGAFVQPQTVDQVQRLMRFCADRQIPIVPQGGNTGHVGGAVGRADGVLLSLSKLNKIRAVDPIGGTMTVDAGCILQTVQQEADRHDLLFPLSLASEGSCQIGGTLATNAGGVHVVKYGTMRDLVLGLEVVLADGRIVDGLSALAKDNTGYDLKHLFMGSEGTLGVITGAVLKLSQKPTARETALFSCESMDHMLSVFHLFRRHFGDGIEAFEMMPRFGIDLALRHTEGARDPLDHEHAWYGLVDVVAYGPTSDLTDRLMGALTVAIEQGWVKDGVCAQNLTQAQAWWALREGMSAAQKKEGGSVKHDIALPIAQVPAFMTAAAALVLSLCPTARLCTFGHVGDGNIHYNITQPVDMDRAAFMALGAEITPALYDLVASYGGTFSAEHGVGRIKRTELAAYRGGQAYSVMQQIKAQLDPQGIMNPEVLF